MRLHILKPLYFNKIASTLVFLFFIHHTLSAQCLTNKEFAVKIELLKLDTAITAKEKLPAFYSIKSKFEK